jgi:hypothetical protein
MRRFEEEIGPREERGFVALTWDPGGDAEGELAPFLEDGFTAERTVVLATDSIVRPEKVDDTLMVRPIESAEDWARTLDIHPRTWRGRESRKW